MKSKGFTFIELIIIIAIVGILAAIAIPNFLVFKCKAYGRELGLNEKISGAICKNVETNEKYNALDAIANGSKKAHDFLSSAVLKELIDEGVNIIVPTEKTKEPGQCVLEESIIKDLRLQIKHLRSPPKVERIIEKQSWRE